VESVTISKCNLEIDILLAKIVIHQCLGERHCCSLCLGLGPTCCSDPSSYNWIWHDIKYNMLLLFSAYVLRETHLGTIRRCFLLSSGADKRHDYCCLLLTWHSPRERVQCLLMRCFLLKLFTYPRILVRYINEWACAFTV